MWVAWWWGCERAKPPPPAEHTAEVATGETGRGGHTGLGPTGDTAPTGPIEAVPGAWCPVEDVVGFVQVTDTGYSPPSVWAMVWDRRDPWMGPPALTTPTCAHHAFQPDTCGTCPPGEVCGQDGSCTPERRTDKDAVLVLTADGDERTYEADDTLGQIYAELDLPADADFGARLTWAGGEVTLPPLPIAGGDLGDVHVRVASNDFFRPGALDATWDPPPDGGVVRSRVPINHHAAGPTFTECETEGADGAFHADAPMIDPLAVVTGLEFQGLEHWQVAAAQVAGGCIDFRLGRQLYVPVEVPP